MKRVSYSLITRSSLALCLGSTHSNVDARLPAAVPPGAVAERPLAAVAAWLLVVVAVVG